MISTQRSAAGRSPQDELRRGWRALYCNEIVRILKPVVDGVGAAFNLPTHHTITEGFIMSKGIFDSEVRIGVASKPFLGKAALLAFRAIAVQVNNAEPSKSAKAWINPTGPSACSDRLRTVDTIEDLGSLFDQSYKDALRNQLMTELIDKGLSAG
jgi:hypothetical protein